MLRSPNPPFSLQVPQRMDAAESVLEDFGGGAPGVWGAWGPWSACSRSCSGGVMEQTRPCLPSSYRARGTGGSSKPGNIFPGHVVSAVRTSVPLHRTHEEPHSQARAAARRQGTGLRGSRHPTQSRRREPAVERRYRPSLSLPQSQLSRTCVLSVALSQKSVGALELLLRGWEEFLSLVAPLIV